MYEYLFYAIVYVSVFVYVRIKTRYYSPEKDHKVRNMCWAY